MAGEVKTQGTVLKRGTGTGSPETFETVTGVLDFSGPSTSRNEIDTTDLSSTAKEYLLGLKDEGEITFNGKFIPSSSVHQAVLSDLDENDPGNWRIEFSDGETIADFAAGVKGAPITGGVDDVVKYAITLRLSGPVTWTYPA